MPEAAIARCLALSRQARSLQGGAQAAALDELDAALAALRAPQATIELDLAGFLTGWDQGAASLFGYTAAEALGKHVLFLYDEDDAGEIAGLDGADESSLVCRRSQSGQPLWLRQRSTLRKDAQGEPLGISLSFSPGERHAEALAPALHARIVEDSAEGVLITDGGGRIVSVNPALSRISGYPAAELLGQDVAVLDAEAGEDGLLARLRTARTDGGWRGEILGRRKNGEAYPQAVTISVTRDGAGRVSHSYALFSDISEHKDAEARMQRMANFDSVTGLPNLYQLGQLLDQALQEARRTGQHGAVMVVEIGRMAAIRDTLGHELGNELLCEIGRLFRHALRGADVLARLEGSRFGVALLQIEKREHAAIVASKLLATLAAPLTVGGHSLKVDARIGIAAYPEDGSETRGLIRCADAALSRAGRSGDSALLFYSEEMNQRAKEHLRIESELRQALQGDQLELFYQPKVNLINGSIVGAEALLRWRHPERGLVAPGVFIPVAEETGLILELGSWVLEQACRQVRAWQDAGLRMPPVAINLSARQFDAELPQRIEAALQRHGLRPQHISLEITESLLVRGADQVISIMNALVAMGMVLALDDFGTGDSSLAYLKKFPIHTLKIDRAFVTGLPHEANDCAIARAIVTLAQQLRQEIVAEGVETVEQMHFLRALGCHQLQGYLFSPPVPAPDFARMLGQGRRLAL